MSETTEQIEPMLTPSEVSALTKGVVTEKTLAVWRVKNRKGRKRVNLAYVKFGGRVLYRVSDVRAFLDSRTVTPGEPKATRSGENATRRGSR